MSIVHILNVIRAVRILQSSRDIRCDGVPSPHILRKLAASCTPRFYRSSVLASCNSAWFEVDA